MRDQHGVQVDSIDLPVPTSRAAILAAFDTYFAQVAAGKAVKPKAAVIDHLTSATALNLPIKELVARCREHGVLSIVDGAHAIGQVDIDLKAMDPDFYVTNCHKWLFAPRACGTPSRALSRIDVLLC